MYSLKMTLPLNFTDFVYYQMFGRIVKFCKACPQNFK
jgi:hypothetical protein